MLVWKHLHFISVFRGCDSHVMTPIWNLIFISKKEWKHPSPCHYNPDIRRTDCAVSVNEWSVIMRNGACPQTGTLSLSLHSIQQDKTVMLRRQKRNFLVDYAVQNFVLWFPHSSNTLLWQGRQTVQTSVFLLADYTHFNTSDPSPLIRRQEWTSGIENWWQVKFHCRAASKGMSSAVVLKA